MKKKVLGTIMSGLLVMGLMSDLSYEKEKVPVIIQEASDFMQVELCHGGKLKFKMASLSNFYDMNNGVGSDEIDIYFVVSEGKANH